MKNFGIVKLTQQNQVLVLIYDCESPFCYLPEIAAELKTSNFNGTVIFDELLHSGNTKERFISGSFENGSFQKESFQFIPIKKQDTIRMPMCRYLKNDLDYLHSSGLTSSQIKLIEKDCVI